MLLTSLIVGVFYVLSHAVTIGYGLSASDISAFVSAAAPFATLADRYGNGVPSVFVNLSVVSSFIALDNVTAIAVTRIFWRWDATSCSRGRWAG